MSQSNRIDILLATYNGEAFVERQLASIVEQMQADCRLLIRDDRSTDETPAIVRRAARKHPGRVVLMEDDEPNLGACGCFGRLLEQSDADYVVFCDQDDVWLPGRIARPIERIQSVEQRLGRDTPVLAHTDLVVVDEHLRKIAPSFWSYSKLDPLHCSGFNRLLVQNVVTGCATTINRALARRACPIPREALMHDWWLALVGSALGRVEAISDCTVLYRQHSHNKLGATRYDWRYVLQRAKEFFCRGTVDQWRRTTQQQAAEFLQRFASALMPADRLALEAYVGLGNAGFFERRKQLLKFGFLKTGSLRNIGWLMMI